MRFGLFTPRSADRDRQNDQARLNGLVSRIADVRTGVMRERRGLERRYADTVGQASHLVDSDYSVEREAEDEAELTRLEDGALYAQRRMAELDRQLELLDGLAERVKVMFDPPDELEKRRKG